MLRLSPLGALVLIATVDATAFGQEVVEIDAEAGRTIIDDEWRSMYYGSAVVDWTRGIFYVEDEEEPEGIMAFALDNGEWLQPPTPQVCYLDGAPAVPAQGGVIRRARAPSPRRTDTLREPDGDAGGSELRADPLDQSDPPGQRGAVRRSAARSSGGELSRGAGWPLSSINPSTRP